MKLEAGRLNLWVFGPGIGEFVVVHVPPDGWLSIDGCSADAQEWPLKFFRDQVGVAPTHILMTHPHADHARGIRALVEHFTPHGRVTWPRLGVVAPPRRKGDSGASQDAFDSRLANGVLTAVKTRWRRQPASKWTPRAGQREPLGSGEVLTLSPAKEALNQAGEQSFDWNRVATALAVEWSGHRVVLGADLVEKPGKGWSAVLGRAPVVRKHVILKVAHHGSLEAQHEALLKRLAGEDAVTLVTTPFASQDLPRFGRSDGADLLLKHSDKLLLSGLPQAFETQNRRPRQWRRSRLALQRKPIAPDEPVGDFPSNYVHLVLSAAGKVKANYGPGSVIVHRG
ncbi:MAG: hypothetical protein IT380_29015 [Myxococcales bacterium]|nr:hypothetical protein [Myxococcales bacterium]